MVKPFLNCAVNKGKRFVVSRYSHPGYWHNGRRLAGFLVRRERNVRITSQSSVLLIRSRVVLTAFTAASGGSGFVRPFRVRLTFRSSMRCIAGPLSYDLHLEFAFRNASLGGVFQIATVTEAQRHKRMPTYRRGGIRSEERIQLFGKSQTTCNMFRSAANSRMHVSSVIVDAHLQETHMRRDT